MGYSIYIGEAVPEGLSDYDEEDRPTEPRFEVHSVSQDDAPTFPQDEMTGKSNGRHPSYSAWCNFAKIVGLDAFFDKSTGVMREHPGCFYLTQEHADAVTMALEKFRRAKPNAVPRFSNTFSGGTATATDEDASLARLIWLEWWVRWAVKNCKRPAISNS